MAWWNTVVHTQCWSYWITLNPVTIIISISIISHQLQCLRLCLRHYSLPKAINRLHSIRNSLFHTISKFLPIAFKYNVPSCSLTILNLTIDRIMDEFCQRCQSIEICVYFHFRCRITPSVNVLMKTEYSCKNQLATLRAIILQGKTVPGHCMTDFQRMFYIQVITALLYRASALLNHCYRSE